MGPSPSAAAPSPSPARAGSPPPPPSAVAQATAAHPPARKATIHLVIAFAAFIVITVAQLYAFTQMTVLADRSSDAVRILFMVSAGAFFSFTLLSLVRQSTLMAFAFGGAVRAQRKPLVEREHWPTVSILVPAHNEAGRIEKAIEAILKLDYPALEVVVVDDGSTDDTYALARPYAGAHGSKRVQVIHKENGGKWSALNLAFHSATGDLVVCVDADSQLAHDCLKLLARHFDDPKLGGCCGQVSVRNRVNLITRLQALEYHLLNGLLRQAQSAFGSVLVAPGPIAMFRRRVLEQVWMNWGKPEVLPLREPGRRINGPWEDDTFAEDADLTLNILLTGHTVTYEPRAISRTSAPDHPFRLLNQRYRWTRGNFQAVAKAWKRWHTAPNPLRLLPLWLGTFLLETLALPAMNLLGMAAFVTVIAVFGVNTTLLIWFLSLTLIDLNEALFCAKVEGAGMKLVPLTLVSRVYYNLLLDVSKFFALFDEARGKGMRWS